MFIDKLKKEKVMHILETRIHPHEHHAYLKHKISTPVTAISKFLFCHQYVLVVCG